ncbi:thioredoxin family protein [Marivita sp. S6314]|uniref:thioredoxin family protein n=1 Tax=Marivita sp. S6314 TaxID=2926406 RepID=UPI001FF30F10|nr:thioredoxin family protein [Marivita sp. S6314]MCK0150041.1 thioredoxin family protein [Marivita sp. S6314]
MDRRTFLTLTAAAATLPLAASADILDYTPGLVKERLAKGETVFLDFTASWCSTCRSQGRTIRALKDANPAYAQQVTFIDVDWDSYGKSDLAKSLQIPRRSTLVVLKGDRELGRIVAQTGQDQIKALMDTALSAATS